MASNSFVESRNYNPTTSKPSRNIRIVGKVRGFSDRGERPLPWIEVNKCDENDSSGGVVISVRDQSGSCKASTKLDNCYEQHENNEHIFVNEIKHLVSEAFDGQKSTVIAFGARSSGKTYTIQGFEENPGLAVLTMAEVLLMAEDAGYLVSVSFYEILHEKVYDLLQTDRPEIKMFEDAQGNVNLKGLSQVNITSFSQFKSVYFGLDPRKVQPPSELPQRSHKNLLILISSVDENSTNKSIGKINLVDLAGYEDSRRKSSLGVNLVEAGKINKSLYALLKVLYSLNAKDTHVSYRESKLTRTLQDSLGRKNKVLVITCLNPFFCHDSLHALISVSRCLVVNRAISECKKTMGSLCNSQSYKSQKASSTITGRRLFHDENTIININKKKENDSLKVASDVRAPATDIVATSDVILEVPPRVIENNNFLTLHGKGEFIAEEERLVKNENESPPPCSQIHNLSIKFKALHSNTSLKFNVPYKTNTSPPTDVGQITKENGEGSTKENGEGSSRVTGMKQTLVEECLHLLNTSNKEELKKLHGIGEKRATYIIQLREESPLKNLDDLQNIGMSSKQIKKMMMRKMESQVFS